MKNVTILGLVQALLSLISGILISKMSFIGKIGISTMYREYTIFKTWWKTALLLLVIQLVLIAVLQLFKAKVSVSFSRLLAFLLIVLGGIGAYFTYIDFTTTSHKMMKLSFQRIIFSKISYLPIQKREKIFPKTSSLLTAPVIEPK